MLGLDTWIAHFSDGATLALVAVVAVVLGLRHASDPDHLAAVTTLIATGRDRAARAAARLGLAWGDRKSTRLNSSHTVISYAVFCLKKKTKNKNKIDKYKRNDDK